MPSDRDTLLNNADHGGLVRAAARLLGPAEAEDAVQDAYVRALEAAPPGVNAAQAWLLTVVRHLAVDRLRRRDWMRQWLASAHEQASTTASTSSSSTAPSAETMALLAEEVAHALRLMAARLTPMDGAALILHEVFGVEHAEIARANGQSEAASRQRLRRALARLALAGHGAGETGRHRVDVDADAGSEAAPEGPEDALFHQYLACLRLRDPGSLWAMLREPPIRAMAGPAVPSGMSGTSAAARRAAVPLAPSAAASSSAGCAVLQVGGQLGLVLTLDGVTLCVLPLGTRAEDGVEPSPNASLEASLEAARA